MPYKDPERDQARRQAPGYKRQRREHEAARRKSDPAYRERQADYQRKRRAARGPLSPEQQAAQRAYQREWRASKRAADTELIERDRLARERYEESGRRPTPGPVSPQKVAAARARLDSIQAATRTVAGRTKKRYTPAEDATVLRRDLTRAEIAFRLGRTLNSVVYRRNRLEKERSNG